MTMTTQATVENLIHGLKEKPNALRLCRKIAAAFIQKTPAPKRRTTLNLLPNEIRNAVTAALDNRLAGKTSSQDFQKTYDKANATAHALFRHPNPRTNEPNPAHLCDVATAACACLYLALNDDLDTHRAASHVMEISETLADAMEAEAAKLQNPAGEPGGNLSYRAAREFHIATILEISAQN